ncbi:MAG TPA: transglycosylase domain-containing protein [Thermoanaerobaculia bacterium]|nr:transglycosylase domain-containing protein [Thermoanaerobaculia bacterium]
MKRALRWILALFLFVLFLLLAVVAAGFLRARDAAAQIESDAALAAEAGFTAADLTPEWRSILLAVEDPSFESHNGVDFRTPGSGLTTITQGLAKRACFDEFAPGVFAKLFQTGCALGIDRRVSKETQLTAFLHTASLGPGESGWITGFPAAAMEYFGKEMRAMTTREFTTLVAMLIGPARHHPRRNPEALDDRIERIERLLAGDCRPDGFRDVTYEGCRGL